MGFDTWWTPGVPLEDDEQLVLEVMANQTVSRWRALGGKLTLTDRRLRFSPNRVDRALSGKAWTVPLGAITEVGRKPQTWNLFDGGLRTRLSIVTQDGAAHLFVVNGLDRVIDTIQGQLPA